MRLLYMPSNCETKRRITRAVDRPLGEMTVEAICRNAGVSKPTFYRHFKSKYDIPRWVFDSLCEASLNRIGRTMTWEEGLRLFFELGISGMPGFRFLRSDAREHEMMNEYMLRVRREAIRETLAMHGIAFDGLLQSIVNGYTAVELYYTEERLDISRNSDVDAIVSTVLAFVPPILFDALNRPIEQVR